MFTPGTHQLDTALRHPDRHAGLVAVGRVVDDLLLQFLEAVADIRGAIATVVHIDRGRCFAIADRRDPDRAVALRKRPADAAQGVAGAQFRGQGVPGHQRIAPVISGIVGVRLSRGSAGGIAGGEGVEGRLTGVIEAHRRPGRHAVGVAAVGWHRERAGGRGRRAHPAFPVYSDGVGGRVEEEDPGRIRGGGGLRRYRREVVAAPQGGRQQRAVAALVLAAGIDIAGEEVDLDRVIRGAYPGARDQGIGRQIALALGQRDAGSFIGAIAVGVDLHMGPAPPGHHRHRGVLEHRV